MRRFSGCLLLALLASFTAADAGQEELQSPSTRVEVRAFGLGLFPLDGHFTRFRGAIRSDPAHPGVCSVTLLVDATSLTMAEASVRDQILGPEFMDAARYPDFAFDGTCGNGTLDGALRLHGETHPVSLSVDRNPDLVTATGRLRRGDWGMTARSLLAGSMIRIRVIAPNPAAPVSGPSPR